MGLLFLEGLLVTCARDGVSMLSPTVEHAVPKCGDREHYIASNKLSAAFFLPELWHAVMQGHCPFPFQSALHSQELSLRPNMAIGIDDLWTCESAGGV